MEKMDKSLKSLIPDKKTEIGIGDQEFIHIHGQEIHKILIILVHIVWMHWLWHYIQFGGRIHLKIVQYGMQIWEEIVIPLDQ